MAEVGENSQSVGLTRDIETSKRNISSKIIEKGGIVFGKKPTPDNFSGQLSRKVIITESILRLDSETPSPGLEQGFNLARDYINSLRKRMGLSEIDPNKMEVLLLEEDRFKKHCKRLSSLAEISSVGFSTDVFQPVVIMKQDDVPEYLMASNAFHELIHQHLETRVRVYSSEEKPDSNDFRVFTEGRRLGLSVSKVKRDGDLIEEQGRLGELLNELPNYLLQKTYIDDVFGKDEFKEVFSEEVKKRDKQLDEYMGEGNDYLSVNFEGKKRVEIHRSVVHFDNDGNLMLEKQTTPFVMMQLAVDLNTLCGKIDGKPFWEALLQAKINPKLQSKLRKEIDSKLGKGFYRRLKTAEYEPESVVDILVEVQNKLYNFDAEQTEDSE